jgi:hypothetical protein
MLIGRVSNIENIILEFYANHRSNAAAEKRDWPAHLRHNASNNTGIVPPDNDTLDKFCEIYIAFLARCDLISFAPHGDRGVLEQFHRVISRFAVHQDRIVYSYGHAFAYPFMSNYYKDGSEHWSAALKDKTVLVISPFEASILRQIERLEQVYAKCPSERPCWHAIKVVKAPLTQMTGKDALASNSSNTTWAAEIDNLKQKIVSVGDFDIALVGCGSYNFPVSLFIVEEVGRHAVMVAGVLQLLFGINGGRYLRDKNVTDVANESWVRPDETERPQNWQSIEGGCYW